MNISGRGHGHQVVQFSEVGSGLNCASSASPAAASSFCKNESPAAAREVLDLPSAPDAFSLAEAFIEHVVSAQIRFRPMAVLAGGVVGASDDEWSFAVGP